MSELNSLVETLDSKGKNHSQKYLYFAGLLIIFLFFTITVFFSVPEHLNDDSIISYRFVWNLVRGYGLVNYAGGPHVEGYSNPLLVFSTAAIAWILKIHQIKKILQIGLLVNTLAAFGILYLITRWSITEFGFRWQAFIPAFILAINHPFAMARNSGLETILFSFTVTCMVYAAKENFISLSALCAFGVFIGRAEGFLPAGICMLLILWGCRNDRDLFKRRLLRIGIFFVLPALIFLVWRYWYFGNWVANTVLIKGNIAERGFWEGKGLKYLYAGLISSPVFIILYISVISRFAGKSNRRFYRYETFIILAQIVFVILVGGDDVHFGIYRFILPVLPLMHLSIIYIFRWNNRSAYHIFITSLLVISSLVHLSSAGIHWQPIWKNTIYTLKILSRSTLVTQKSRLFEPKPWVDEYAGQFIASLVPGDGRNLSLASCQAGSLPIHWKGAFYDVIGLTSRDYAIASDRDLAFRNNPPDIVAVFRWKEGWISIPSGRTFWELGYQPVILIQIKNSLLKLPTDFPMTLNFMIFVKDSTILDLTKTQWNGVTDIMYSDYSGEYFEKQVLVKVIDFDGN